MKDFFLLFSLSCNYYGYFRNLCSEIQGKRKTSWNGAALEIRTVILGKKKKKKKKKKGQTTLEFSETQTNAYIVWVC